MLRYADFDVTIKQAKSLIQSYDQIYFEDGTLDLNAVNAIEEAAFYERQTKQTHPLAVAALTIR